MRDASTGEALSKLFQGLFDISQLPEQPEIVVRIMPRGQGNETGSSEPHTVPYGSWKSFPEQPFPMYAGTKSIIYRSTDGKVVVGMLREKGKDTLVWPVDEFLFVTQGTIHIEVHGGETFTLGKGDLMVMKKGQTITFECSEDFANVAVFMDLEDKVTLV